MPFLHTSWRQHALAGAIGTPLEPGGVHGGYLADEVTATSDTDITVMTARYAVRLTAFIQPETGGANPLAPEFMGTLNPVMIGQSVPLDLGPYPNPWTGSQSAADFTASDMLTLSWAGTLPASSAHSPTFAATWQAKGETHGMRRITGPGTATFRVILGWYYGNSWALEASQNPGVFWSVETFTRAKFGSSTSLT